LHTGPQCDVVASPDYGYTEAARVYRNITCHSVCKHSVLKTDRCCKQNRIHCAMQRRCRCCCILPVRALGPSTFSLAPRPAASPPASQRAMSECAQRDCIQRGCDCTGSHRHEPLPQEPKRQAHPLHRHDACMHAVWEPRSLRRGGAEACSVLRRAVEAMRAGRTTSCALESWREVGKFRRVSDHSEGRRDAGNEKQSVECTLLSLAMEM
jgi:hypothetical protein